MKKVQLLTQYVATSVAIAMLSACGGGGSSNIHDTPTTPSSTESSELETIVSYAEGESSSAPTVEDYEESGLVGVDETIIDEVNSEIFEASDDDVDTIEEIQEIINEVNRTNFAQGAITLDGTQVSLASSGLSVSNIFKDNMPLTEQFKIIRSEKAVTLGSQFAQNYNSNKSSRYLEIDTVNDNQKQVVIEFTGSTIANMLGGINLDDIVSARLYLWNEHGRSTELVASTLESSFNENSVATKNDVTLDRLVASVELTGDIGWKTINLPRDIIRSMVNNPNDPLSLFLEASNQGEALSFSSDETTRSPALVLTYSSNILVPPQQTINEALGIENDNEQAEANISISPASLREGDNFRATVNISDNEKLDYAKVYLQGNCVNLTTGPITSFNDFSTTAENTTQRNLVYQGTLVHDSVCGDEVNATLEIVAEVEDTAGLAYKKRIQKIIPVAKSDHPTISTDIIYRDANTGAKIMEVYPEYYRLIRHDNQEIEININAADSNGIAHVTVQVEGESSPHNFDTDDPISFSVRNNNEADAFQYTVTATDTLGISSTYTSEAVPIREYSDLHLYNNALTFNNFSRDKIDYVPYMKNIFGYSEAHKQHCFAGKCVQRRTSNGIFWHTAVIKGVGRKGLCVGMNGTSIALSTGEIVPSQLVVGATRSNEISASGRAYEYLTSKHASQISLEYVGAIAEHLSRTHHNEVEWVRNNIINSLDGTFSNYGSVSIFPDGYLSGGHAIVPWLAKKFDTGDWKVYVYDSNLETGPADVQSGGNPDFNTFEKFPFINFFTDNTWNYWYSSQARNWDGKILFFNHNTVVGDSERNTIDTETNLRIHDHDLPNLKNSLYAIIGYSSILVEKNSNVEIVIEDENGNSQYADATSTGNGVIPFPLMDINTDEIAAYLLPNDKTYSIKAIGQHEGNYSIHLDSGRMFSSIKGKQIASQVTDTITLSPSMEKDNRTFEITSALNDAGFEIDVQFDYAIGENGTLVESEKSYTLSNITIAPDQPLTLKVDNFANDLNVKTKQLTPLQFNLEVISGVKESNTSILFNDTVNLNTKSSEQSFSYTLSSENEE